MRRILALSALALTVALAPAMAGASSGGPAARQMGPETATLAFSPDEAAPVPVPEPTEKAMRFYRSGNMLWCIRTVWELSVPALILFTGFSSRLSRWAERTGRNWLFALAIYLAAFMAIKYVLEFPLSCYQGFFRQHAYDLSNQPFGRWFGSSLKRLGVDTTVCAMFLWIPFLLMRSSPRRWWLYTWMAATAATV